MRQEASLEPGRLHVRRQFEVYRLAGECQTLAYERVVPGSGMVVAGSRPSDQIGSEGGNIEAWELAKGVAG